MRWQQPFAMERSLICRRVDRLTDTAAEWLRLTGEVSQALVVKIREERAKLATYDLIARKANELDGEDM